MKYGYELSRQAASYLRRLPPQRTRQFFELMALLCADPFDPTYSAALHGQKSHLRRARIGDLRVIFEVVRETLVIYVQSVRPRGDAYKG